MYGGDRIGVAFFFLCLVYSNELRRRFFFVIYFLIDKLELTVN